MVNAKKHKILKVLNAITRPEREITQEINRKKKYDKTKFYVNSKCNFHKQGFGKLENHYH